MLFRSEDTPATLPDPAHAGLSYAATALHGPTVAKDVTVNKGSLPGFLHAALATDLKMTPAAQPAIMAEFSSIQTQADAAKYMDKVSTKMKGLGDYPVLRL